jgi:hypothetical protein
MPVPVKRSGIRFGIPRGHPYSSRVAGAGNACIFSVKMAYFTAIAYIIHIDKRRSLKPRFLGKRKPIYGYG